jgi:hypothetical protein
MEPTLASKYANSGYYKTVEELLEHNTVANLQTPKAAYIARRIAPRQSIEQVGSEEENFLCQAVLRTPPSFCENENREKLEKILATVLGQFWKFVPNAKPIIHVTGNAILAHLNQQTEELTFSFWRGQSFSKHNKDLYTASNNKTWNDQDEYPLEAILNGNGVPLNSLADLSKIPSLDPPEEIFSSNLNKNFIDRGSDVFVYKITNIIFIIQSINLRPNIRVRKFFDIPLGE